MNRESTYKMLMDLGFNPKTIVDCGAAWGEWSGMIRGYFPDSFIIGIDANKWSENKIPNTNVSYIEALSDEDNKEMIFYKNKSSLDSNTFCTGDSLFKENTIHYNDSNLIKDLVKTRTLESLLKEQNKDKIDLLKIDTQGSEILIMKGLGDLLKEVEFIELECSVVEFNIGGCSFYDVINFLKEDFDIFEIPTLIRIGGYLCQMDVIFKNKKSKIKSL